LFSYRLFAQAPEVLEGVILRYKSTDEKAIKIRYLDRSKLGDLDISTIQSILVSSFFYYYYFTSD
jgi:hypothetical protein